MKIDDAWKNFIKTGSVENYLIYSGIKAKPEETDETQGKRHSDKGKSIR